MSNKLEKLIEEYLLNCLEEKLKSTKIQNQEIHISTEDGGEEILLKVSADGFVALNMTRILIEGLLTEAKKKGLDEEFKEILREALK